MVLYEHNFVSLIQVKISLQKTFNFANWLFSEGINIFETKMVLFPESSIIIGRVERKNNFQTIVVMIFWLFLIILIRCKSPQVKCYLISSITNLVHKLPPDLPNDLRLRMLGNIREMSNVVGDAAQWPVFLSETKP